MDLNILRQYIIHSLQEDHSKHWHHFAAKVSALRCRYPRQFWQDIHKLRSVPSTRITYLIHILNTHWPAYYRRTMDLQHFQTGLGTDLLTTHSISKSYWTYPHTSSQTNISTLVTKIASAHSWHPYRQTGEVQALCESVRHTAPGISSVGKNLLHQLPSPLSMQLHIYSMPL